MSVLLLGADDYGTLAAVRCYGRDGIKVIVADQSRRGRALFSRYAEERLVHPPLSTPDELVDWLVNWGERHPGTFIYPSNDDLAWLFASERDRLGRSFRMFSPNETTIVTLLDKLRLSAACADVGIETPQSVGLGDAASAGDAADRIDHLGYPVLLKPRVRIMLQTGVKGFIVQSPAELASRLARFRRHVTFNSFFTTRHPELAEPIAQEYFGLGETSILSLAGFVDAAGACVALASMKILQRPRRVGIGLCFETCAIEEPLVAKLAALCRQVGYAGVFEAEFVTVGDRRLLIDFNPRFYSQMGFEVARGLELPLLVWREARGEGPESDGNAAQRERERDADIYCHKGMLDLILALQRVSGRMSRDEVKSWRSWYRRASGAGSATDAVRDPDDPKPAWVDGASWIGGFARHPRSFVNSFVLNR
ncbi:MAG: carboxylate--amine ligase [Gaiellaceae bacterium]